MLTFLQFLLEANFGVGNDEDYPSIPNKKGDKNKRDTTNGYLEFKIYNEKETKTEPPCEPYEITSIQTHGKASHAIKHLIDSKKLYNSLVSKTLELVQKYITANLNTTVDKEKIIKTIESIKSVISDKKNGNLSRKVYKLMQKFDTITPQQSDEFIIKTISSLNTHTDYKKLPDDIKGKIDNLISDNIAKNIKLVIEWHKSSFEVIYDSTDMEKNNIIDSFEKINNNTILNTLDYIQDKTYTDKKLNDIESEIYKEIIKKYILPEYTTSIENNSSENSKKIDVTTIKKIDFDNTDDIKTTIDKIKTTYINIVDNKSDENIFDTKRFQAIFTAKTKKLIITHFNCAEISLTKGKSGFVCPIYPIMSDENKKRLVKIIGFSYMLSSVGDYNPNTSKQLRDEYKRKLDELAEKFINETEIKKEHKEFFQKNKEIFQEIQKKEYDSSLEKYKALENYKDLDAYKAEYEREYDYLTKRVINYNARKEIRFGKY